MLLCIAMLAGLFMSSEYAPAMSVRPVRPSAEHRSATLETGFVPSPLMWSEIFAMKRKYKRKLYKKMFKKGSVAAVALSGARGAPKFMRRSKLAVTKALSHAEVAQCPEVQEAIRAEAKGLLAMNTWDESTVRDKQRVIDDAKRSGRHTVIGDLLVIGSIKFFEREKSFWKYKGRICYRGDAAKDQNGAYAIYQELNASPTSIHSANSNLAYGMLPGNATTQADAVRAYVQSTLKSKHDTWVTIPPLLQPKKWRGKYNRPTCRLIKSLYGHPESGAHWEQHLTAAIRRCGGEPVDMHPSSFYMKDLKLLLTVYVDDLLLSGPAGNHEKFWRLLTDKKVGNIRVEDPEPLDRFLGRKHVTLKSESTAALCLRPLGRGRAP